MPFTLLTFDEDQIEIAFSKILTKLESIPEEYREMLLPDLMRLNDLVSMERDRLNAVLQALPVGVWITDPNGNVLKSNPLADQIQGGPSPTVKDANRSANSPCLRSKTGEPLPFDEVPVIRVLREEQPLHNVEVNFERRDGTQMMLLTAAAPILDSAGQRIGAVGIAQDISLQKQIEQELHASRAEIVGILESINDGFFAFDRNWRYTFINKRSAEPLGYQPEELIGRNLWDVFPKMRGTVAEKHYRLAMEERIPSQYRIQGVYSGRWFDISVYPSQNGISVFSIDRTEEVLAEQALRESENRFRVALANAAIAVFSTDRHLRYNWFYSSHMQSMQTGMIGKQDDEILPGPGTAKLMKIKQRALEQGVAIRDEIQLEIPSGVRNLIVSVEPYSDLNGETAGVIGAYYDITDQRRLEAENIQHIAQREVQRRLLEYRERERQEIARDLHDGPIQDLSSLIFSVQYAKEAAADAAAKLDFEQIGLGLKSVVRDLREMINLLRPPSLIRFGLARALRLHLEDFGERHPEFEIEASLMDDCDRLSEGMRLGLFRIVQEALNNATRHAHATRLSVRLGCTEGQAILEIQDNGRGFSVSPSLLDYTIKGHFGLVGMKERAEAIGGKFEVESALERGTIIRAVIPIQSA